MVQRLAAPPQTALPPAQPNGKAAAVKTFSYSRGVGRKAHRTMIYGTGGVGKSTLASGFPSPVFADLQRGTQDLDVRRVNGISDWSDLRAWLQGGKFDDCETIVIDPITDAEDWCRQWVIENVQKEKGGFVKSIEGYGWNKGYVHLLEEWRRLLADLEAHYQRGKNIVLVCHDRTGKKPNPDGDDYLRNEPRLYNGKEVSLMYVTHEWCDHVLFVGYDVTATDGKAKGSGTRTIYTAETATYMAKSRTLPPEPFEFRLGENDLWARLSGKKNADDGPPM